MKYEMGGEGAEHEEEEEEEEEVDSFSSRFHSLGQLKSFHSIPVFLSMRLLVPL